MLGAAYHARSTEMEAVLNRLHLSYQDCIEIKKLTTETCSAEWQRDYVQIYKNPDWGNIAFVSFAPIILGWILAFITIRVYRWIKAGET